MAEAESVEKIQRLLLAIAEQHQELAESLSRGTRSPRLRIWGLAFGARLLSGPSIFQSVGEVESVSSARRGRPRVWRGCVARRRIVLAALSFGFAGTAVALVLLPRSLPAILPAAALLGGFMSTLYPVCVAHANDRMPADRVVAMSGRLILWS